MFDLIIKVLKYIKKEYFVWYFRRVKRFLGRIYGEVIEWKKRNLKKKK